MPAPSDSVSDPIAKLKSDIIAHKPDIETLLDTREFWTR
jgi:hypothetical protein